MDKFQQFLQKLSEQLKLFWGKLDFVKRAILIGTVGAMLIGLLYLGASSTKKEYEYLFINLSEEDTHEISSQLKGMGFQDYIIDQKGIKVTPENIVKLRLQLAQEGLPSKGNVGWEKFDQQDFARTEFEQKIQKNRAIQGELSRTINSIHGVISSRVHIVVPNKSVFLRENKEPTASIYIKTKTGVDLSKKQIKGVQHLVSKAVEGLRPQNVSIIDQEGTLLTEVESDDENTKLNKERIEYTNQVEKKMEEKITSLVARIVGPDRVEAKVTANIDFTSEHQTISDIDPDDIAVASKNSSGMSMEGSGLNPTGIPGAKSNIPGEQEPLQAATSKTGSKKESEIVNYEISKTISERTLPMGNIKRISAAVIVDGKQAYPSDGSPAAFDPRSAEELKKIDELVKNAIGYKDGQDTVTVHNLMFQLDPIQLQQMTTKQEEDRHYISTLAISATVAFSLILFFLFIVRPYFRWLSYDPEMKQKQKLVDEFKPELENFGIKNIQAQEEVPFDKLSPQEQVIYLARHEPKRTTEALKLLLNPQQNVG